MTALLHPTPGPFAVLREQVRAVGGGLWPEALALAGVLAFLTMLTAQGSIEPGASIDFTWPPLMMMAVAGFALPWGVWRRDPAFGPSYLATLPVDRRLHMLMKVLAGGVWALAAMLVVMVWVAAMVAIWTGGLDLSETRLLMTAQGPRAIDWAPPGWMLAAPFVAIGATYLAGSAVLLGLRRPLVWVLGVGAVTVLALMLGPQAFSDGVDDRIIHGPVGLDFLFTGGLDGLEIAAPTPGDARRMAWTGLPAFGPWATAAAFWLAVAGAALGLALARRREV